MANSFRTDLHRHPHRILAKSAAGTMRRLFDPAVVNPAASSSPTWPGDNRKVTADHPAPARPVPPLAPDELVSTSGEREVLEAFLDLYRDVLKRKQIGR